MTKRAITLAGVTTLLTASACSAGFNLDALTLLARGATQGQNVLSAVPGFDVRLLHAGTPIYHQAFGNWSVNRAANVDSTSKTFSGALVMSLTEQSPNPFSLNTKLSAYIPAFDDEKLDITIRQAFSHTSGLPESSTALANPTISLQQAALVIAGQPLSNGPAGTQFAYGGASMQAAGAVVELAGGDTWNNLFTRRIVQPLGLTSTRFQLTTPSNPRVPGGIESTASDVGIFMESLRRGGLAPDGSRILSQSSVDTMFTRQTPADIPVVSSPVDNARYGVGVWLQQGEAGKLDVLAAGARGFHSWIEFEHELVFVFSTDVSSFSNVQALTQLMYDAVVSAIDQPVRIGDATLDDAVDFDDLLLLAQNYERPNRLWAQGDFTGDGFVGFDDLLLLAQNYDATAGQFQDDWSRANAMVPEPAALGTVAVVGLSLTRRRRIKLGSNR
jgi:CubicO group peptidase (beta-lactamase class C family)